MSGEKQENSNDWGLDNFRSDAKNATIAGVLAAIIILFGSWFIGQISGSEARYLLETLMPNVRSFSGTVVLALGNILALMLTLLGLSTSTDIDLTQYHYKRVRQIARIDTITFIVAVLLYLLLNVPLEETDRSASFYYILYYATLISSSAIAGATITVILMLFNTIKDIINVLGPQETKDYIKRTDEEE